MCMPNLYLAECAADLLDCRPQVNWAMQPSCPKGEIMSLMPYSSDAPGLYECIQRSSAYGIPVYVTETGFPTFNDDHMQTVLDRYLKEVSFMSI